MVIKRNTDKKRNSILDGAQKVFMECGYDNASMDRIAETSGASKRTVYNHFPGKEILFKSVIEQLMTESFALKQIRYDSGKSLEYQLGQFADAKIEFLKNPDWQKMLKITVTVCISNPELIHEALMKAEDEENSLAVWLTEAADYGELAVPDPGLSAHLFWSMMSGAFIMPILLAGSLIRKKSPV